MKSYKQFLKEDVSTNLRLLRDIKNSSNFAFSTLATKLSGYMKSTSYSQVPELADALSLVEEQFGMSRKMIEQQINDLIGSNQNNSQRKDLPFEVIEEYKKMVDAANLEIEKLIKLFRAKIIDIQQVKPELSSNVVTVLNQGAEAMRKLSGMFNTLKEAL